MDYICRKCGAEFARNDSLTRHIQKKIPCTPYTSGRQYTNTPDQGIAKLDQRIDKIEERIDKIVEHIGKLEKRIDQLLRAIEEVTGEEDEDAVDEDREDEDAVDEDEGDMIPTPTKTGPGLYAPSVWANTPKTSAPWPMLVHTGIAEFLQMHHQLCTRLLGMWHNLSWIAR